MIRRVQAYIETNHLLSANKPVIVGFSGGSDSVSLLYILQRLGYLCIAAHCNFHLRGEESDRDEAFCKNFADRHHIVFEKIDFDTGKYAKKHRISIEMAARELRYGWFKQLRQKYEAEAIAVAHQKDDSIETMLLNMIRGCGIRGASGIKAKNGHIVRPLLCVNHAEILKFIEKENLNFVTDSTNLSDEYARNHIRLKIIPLLKKINPSVGNTLARTVEHFSEAEGIYVQAIEKAQQELLVPEGDCEIKIPIDKLLNYRSPETILYEILNPFEFSRQTIHEIFRGIQGESGKIYEAKRFNLLKDRNTLIIFQKTTISNEIFVIQENETPTLPIRLDISIADINDKFVIDKSPSTATFDYDKIRFPLTLRHWECGDYFHPFGMKGKKKLSDYFNDRKFSILEKSRIWLLCSGKNIVWIVGERIDNRYRIDNDTKKALKITLIDD